MEIAIRQGPPEPVDIHENGYWLNRADGWHFYDANLAKALIKMFPVGSRVLDLGCGRGQYVEAIRAAGLEAFGLDGTPGAETIPNCAAMDLTSTAAGALSSDWTLCLEVGEHIPREKEGPLLDAIAGGCQGAVVSWASPGQSGIGHVNCRAAGEVISLLGDRGLTVDAEATRQLREAAEFPWFKNNLLAFVGAGEGLSEMHQGEQA
jgi:SAM-dependent methyltransferase